MSTFAILLRHAAAFCLAALLATPCKADHATRFKTGAFAKYPDYSGSFDGGAIRGTLYFEGVAGKPSSVKVTGKLTGLPETKAAIHIHEGFSTSDAALVGGHYWNQHYSLDDAANDPWTDVGWTTDPVGGGEWAAEATVALSTIEDDMAWESIVGRVVVVHDSTGARVAVAKIQPTAETYMSTDLSPMASVAKASLQTTVSKFTDGSATVGGTVTVTALNFRMADADYLVSYTLSGLPSDDVQGGAHIHVAERTNAVDPCSTPSATGGHYFSGSADPWIQTFWRKSKGETQAQGSFSVTAVGLALGKSLNHAFVIHNEAGDKIGCGILQTVASKAAVQSYPGVSGTVEGLVYVVDLSATSVKLSWQLQGLETTAVTGGIHIHDGKACSVDAAKYISNVVGGHYWDSQDGTIPDPWSTVYSTATTSGKSWGSVEVSNVGYDLASVRDHSIVIHDSTGARVGCGVLERSSKIHGYAYAVYDDSKIKFTANFGGARFMAGSLFGVHVHTGRTCDAPEGHLMIGGEDPWKDFKYAVKDALPNPRGGQDWNNNVNGKFFSGRGYIHAEASGVPRLLDIKDRTVVAHAATGDKIACGILSETSPSDPPSASHGSSLDVGKMSFALVTMTAAGFLFC